MAGGFKNFGPTYNSTPYVRLGYEGLLNGTHGFDPALLGGAASVDEPKVELAGKFAAIGADGVKLAGADGKDAVGLFREDLQDMVNASEKATFYFRGGEYYVAASRTALTDPTSADVGKEITCDADGKMVLKTGDTQRALGVITHVGEYRAGNMYEKVATGAIADTEVFIGFIMFV